MLLLLLLLLAPALARCQPYLEDTAPVFLWNGTRHALGVRADSVQQLWCTERGVAGAHADGLLHFRRLGTPESATAWLPGEARLLVHGDLLLALLPDAALRAWDTARLPPAPLALPPLLPLLRAPVPAHALLYPSGPAALTLSAHDVLDGAHVALDVVLELAPLRAQALVLSPEGLLAGLRSPARESVTLPGLACRWDYWAGHALCCAAGDADRVWAAHATQAYARAFRPLRACARLPATLWLRLAWDEAAEPFRVLATHGQAQLVRVGEDLVGVAVARRPGQEPVLTRVLMAQGRLGWRVRARLPLEWPGSLIGADCDLERVARFAPAWPPAVALRHYAPTVFSCPHDRYGPARHLVDIGLACPAPPAFACDPLAIALTQAEARESATPDVADGSSARGVRAHLDRCLRRALDAVSPDARDAAGTPLLHHAATPGALSVLRQRGADLNARDARGLTALHVLAPRDMALARRLLALRAAVCTLPHDAALLAAEPDLARAARDHACEPGFYLHGAGVCPLRLCEPGFFCPGLLADTNTRLPCPPGTYSREGARAESACQPCPPARPLSAPAAAGSEACTAPLPAAQPGSARPATVVYWSC